MRGSPNPSKPGGYESQNSLAELPAFIRSPGRRRFCQGKVTRGPAEAPPESIRQLLADDRDYGLDGRVAARLGRGQQS